MLIKGFKLCISFTESPAIIENTLNPQIVPGGATAVFDCIARGSPLPEITWMHQGKKVLEENEKYMISKGERNPYTKVSTLSLLSLHTGSSGEVECIASVPSSADTGQIPLEPSSAVTHLTVLGNTIA